MGRALDNAKENLRRAIRHQVMICPSRREVEVERDALELVLRSDQPAVSFRCDMLDPQKTTMELAGGALTRAQLSDLIQAWVNAHPNEQPVTDMLVDWVTTHGRFE